MDPSEEGYVLFTLAQLASYFNDDADVWLDLADAAPSNVQRAYCIKQFQTFKKGLTRWQKFCKIAVDFLRLLW